MLSALSKAYIPLVVVAGAAAFVYSKWTGGDHIGVTMLVSVAVAALLAAVAASFRVVTDTDFARPASGPLGRTAPVAAGRSGDPSAFPILAAAGLALVGIGAASGLEPFVLGAAVVALAAVGWFAQVWREHPLWTDRFGDKLGRRLVGPFALPAVAVACGALAAVSVSRLYLTVTETSAVVLSGVVASALFLGCLLLANGKKVGPRLTGTLVGVAAVAFLVLGVVGYVNGERHIELHASSVHSGHVRVVAEGIEFDTPALHLPEGRVRVTFENRDPEGVYHNIGAYSAREGGTPYFAILAIDGGEQRTTDVNTEVVGLEKGREYWFRCDFHPAMVGALTVVDAPEDHHGSDPHSAEEPHG